MKNTIFTFIVLSCSFLSTSQVDFYNYTTLLSEGEIPEDFSVETYQKVSSELKDKRKDIGTRSQQQLFLEDTRYAIDDLLHSGQVVFGDPVSNYITKVAKRLLNDSPEVLEKLRFYTLKSDRVNAFSTDQGIIFVTTGLIGKLTNEAEIAYILAHEISHYTEHHVLETFVWQNNQRVNREWIESMSVYSKNKEYEADKLAVDIYRKAGYQLDAIWGVFDVLLYSYLPFEEAPITLDYFASEKMYLPPDLFSDEILEISAEEDADDSKSSHPNIKNRKTAVEAEIESLDNQWEENIFQESEEEFKYIRKIARYENIRMHVLNSNFGDALYEIFILEKEGTSLYLDRLKSQTWLNLYQISRNDEWQFLKTKDDWEGESANVHRMLRTMNKNGLSTLSIRTIYDLKNEYKGDYELDAIYNFLLKELGNDDEFTLSSYHPFNFSEAQSQEGHEIDSTNYYKYGLSDIIADNEFNTKLTEHRDHSNEKIQIAENFEKMSAKKRRKAVRAYSYKNLEIGLDKIIVVEPLVISYSSGKIDRVQSEKLEERLSNSITANSVVTGIEVVSIDSRTIKNQIDILNDRSLLHTYLFQSFGDSGFKHFPIDYTLLRGVAAKHGTSNIMISAVEHAYAPDVNWFLVGTSLMMFPSAPLILPIYLPMKVLSGNQTNMGLIVLDIETGNVVAGESYYFNEPIGKHNLGARIYSLFRHLHTNSDK